jgi:hypothetical protein
MGFSHFEKEANKKNSREVRDRLGRLDLGAEKKSEGMQSTGKYRLTVFLHWFSPAFPPTFEHPFTYLNN